jgi:hypothetical protein
LRRQLKKQAAQWVRISATGPVTRKPQGIRMGKGKGAIEFYACAVRPGLIIAEMDRVPRQVRLGHKGSVMVQPESLAELQFRKKTPRAGHTACVRLTYPAPYVVRCLSSLLLLH